MSTTRRTPGSETAGCLYTCMDVVNMHSFFVALCVFRVVRAHRERAPLSPRATVRLDGSRGDERKKGPSQGRAPLS